MDPIEALRPHVATIAGRAAALDDTAGFPAADVALVCGLAFPAVPLPLSRGGTGAGTEPAGSALAFELLRLLGTANLSLGRLFEAHVNVVRLVERFGTAAQRDRVATVCHAGELYGLWVTDGPSDPLRLERGALIGCKGPCSGAGHLRHALVTVAVDGATCLALVDLAGDEPVDALGPRLHGMRAAANGTIRLEGVAAELLGRPGNYLDEPDFSAGAWRTMAVTLGGLDALVDAVRAQLRARKHAEAPLQQARFGKILIARETAALWTRAAGTIAEAGSAAAKDQVAYVNLARIAVESAAFDVMRHTQRALGLAALLRPNPVERLLRDLATYLRQPAPDAVLTEAALHGLARA